MVLIQAVHSGRWTKLGALADSGGRCIKCAVALRDVVPSRPASWNWPSFAPMRTQRTSLDTCGWIAFTRMLCRLGALAVCLVRGAAAPEPTDPLEWVRWFVMERPGVQRVEFENTLLLDPNQVPSRFRRLLPQTVDQTATTFSGRRSGGDFIVGPGSFLRTQQGTNLSPTPDMLFGRFVGTPWQLSREMLYLCVTDDENARSTLVPGENLSQALNLGIPKATGPLAWTNSTLTFSSENRTYVCTWSSRGNTVDGELNSKDMDFGHAVEIEFEKRLSRLRPVEARVLVTFPEALADSSSKTNSITRTPLLRIRYLDLQLADTKLASALLDPKQLWEARGAYLIISSNRLNYHRDVNGTLLQLGQIKRDLPR